MAKDLLACESPSEGAPAEGALTLLGFGGNAWNAEATALTLHALFPHRNVVAFHYRGYAPTAAGRARGRCSGLPHNLRPSLEPRPAARPPIGFSIGAAVAAYLARHRLLRG